MVHCHGPSAYDASPSAALEVPSSVRLPAPGWLGIFKAVLLGEAVGPGGCRYSPLPNSNKLAARFLVTWMKRTKRGLALGVGQYFPGSIRLEHSTPDQDGGRPDRLLDARVTQSVGPPVVRSSGGRLVPTSVNWNPNERCARDSRPSPALAPGLRERLSTTDRIRRLGVVRDGVDWSNLV